MKRYIRAAKITDFMSVDELEQILYDDVNWAEDRFGPFDAYGVKDGMILELVKYSNRIFPSSDDKDNIDRYFKFINNGDNEWEAYEVDEDGVTIGKSFVVMRGNALS